MKSEAFIGISRHRLAIDGDGITTLVTFHGCPLRCRYCLNPQCNIPNWQCTQYTPEELYNITHIDNLYFIATGGGVTFGGGEPLLHPDFIAKFHQLCGSDWRITIETSLNVPQVNLTKIISFVDDYIIDIKDLNDDIYRAYTGSSNAPMLSNLQQLLQHVSPEHIIVRTPLIPGYNSFADVNNSISQLQTMGVSRIDRFEYIERKGFENAPLREN